MLFIENNTYFPEAGSGTGVKITFPASIDVQAFPCARRRSIQLTIAQTQQMWPFDPEARLNTERNNRRHTGINGYRDSYINKININKPTATAPASGQEQKLGECDFTLAGYNFKLSLFENSLPPAFNRTRVESGIDLLGQLILGGLALEESIANSANKLYANIVLEEQMLYTGDPTNATTKKLSASSWLLGRQIIQANSSETALDLLRSVATGEKDTELIKDPANFYFSALSFSKEKITPSSTIEDINGVSIASVELNGKNLIVVSMNILQKSNNQWVINQRALLPDIRHGSTVDSVEVGSLNALNGLTQTESKIPVPSLQVIDIPGTVVEEDQYQKQSEMHYRLKFTTVAQQ